MVNLTITTISACVLASSAAAAYAGFRYVRAKTSKTRPPLVTRKTPSDSAVDALEVLTPGQCTALSTSYGGELLAMVDKVAGACAAKHAEGSIVTVSMSEIHFQTPARVSDIIIMTAKLTAAFKSSMEVEVLVYVEHPITGQQSFCCRALLKFVALDRKRRPRLVPELVPETDAEIKAHKEAIARNEEFKNRRPVRADEIAQLWQNHENEGLDYLPRSKSISLDDTKLEMTKLVMPSHANPLGILFGGQLLQWMEHAAYVSASRLCRSLVLTVGLDQMSFLVQIPVGSVVIIRAQVNRVFITSLEIGVRVEMANWLHGNVQTATHCNSGYFTFVSVDEGKIRPKEIPRNVVPSNDRDRLRYVQAHERRQRRMTTRERSRSTPAPYLHRYSVLQNQ